MSNSSFKMRHPLESRKAESARFREKYPDIIPLVVEKRSDIPNIDGKIYQITADATYRQFEDYVRKCPVLGPEDAMIIFARSISKLPDALMSAIYEDHKDEDGFLYMTPWLETVWMIGNDRIIENLLASCK